MEPSEKTEAGDREHIRQLIAEYYDKYKGRMMIRTERLGVTMTGNNIVKIAIDVEYD